jgi:sulfite reductase (ferredoxin)
VACTGTEFCKLAIAETKGFAKWLVGEMEERLPEFDQQIAAACDGLHELAAGRAGLRTLGSRERRSRRTAKMVDAFYFCVGGAVGEYAGIARQIGYRAAAEDCPEAIERLLRAISGAEPGENLRSYFRRTSDEDLRAAWRVTVVEAVERDAPPGRVPGNVG